MRIRHVGDAEIDNLGRVIRQHQEVARFQVAVHQSALVRGLQAAARLANDFHHPAHRQTAALGRDQFAQGFAGKQRHDEIRLAGAIFVELPEIENLYDIGMTDGGEHVALFGEKLQRGAARGIADGFERHTALYDGVVSVVDHTHPALPQHLTDFVAVFDLLRYSHKHSTLSRRRLSRNIAGGVRRRAGVTVFIQLYHWQGVGGSRERTRQQNYVEVAANGRATRYLFGQTRDRTEGKKAKPSAI